MPQPCRQPLSRNPFESYRDPVTGQWKVRYPASALPPQTQSRAQSIAQSKAPSLSKSTKSTPQSVEEKMKRVPNPRRWKKPSAA
ncbi:MAG: hypothetical protein AAFQ63_00810 [Cyanobacteria bacterium J06621_11]